MAQYILFVKLSRIKPHEDAFSVGQALISVFLNLCDTAAR